MFDNDSLPAGSEPRGTISIDQIFPLDPPKTDFWTTFGFAPAEQGRWQLAPSTVALCATTETGQSSLIDLLKTMGVPSTLAIWSKDRRQALYRVADASLIAELERVVPDEVTLVRPGEAIELPGDWRPSDTSAQTLADLAALTPADIRRAAVPQPDPAVTSNPLLAFSLRGQSDRFKRLAIEAKPLLGEVCLRGQVTIWYAGPGTGKTLVALSLAVDAVREGRIDPGNIFYVNADDNGSGFATKLQIMDDLGAHTLAPGFKGLRNSELIALLHQMADGDEARGVLVIIDTVKKFGSLMDKKESSAIAQAFRQVAMKGGTILGLAHTTKNPNSDGTPRYAGTSDLVDDADAVYTIRPLSMITETKERVVEFSRVKSRGDCAETAAYAFPGEKGVPYDEMLASVRAVDPTQLDDFRRVEDERSDAEAIDVVRACITEGINTKMLLVKEGARRSGISERAMIRLIEKYTGADPAQHRWRFVRAEHGKQVFTLLAAPSELPPPDG